MTLIKVGVAAVNQTPLDWNGNTERLIQILIQAQKDEILFLGLPEMSICGYGCEDAFFAPETQRRSLKSLLALLPHTKNLIVNFGLPLRHNGVVFNCTAVVCDGELIGIIPKKFLAGDGVHYEPRWFKEWPRGFVDFVPWNDFFDLQDFTLGIEGAKNSTDLVEKKLIPIGDICFQWNGIRFGYEICEEAWVAQRPGSKLAELAVDIIFNPSASHFAFGKNEIRKRFVLEGSRAFSCVYIYSNLLGNESGRLIYDGSLFIASHGELVNESKRFSFEDTLLLSSLVDLDSNRVLRQQTSSYNPVFTQSENEIQNNKITRVIQVNNNNNLINKLKSLTPIESQQVSSIEVTSQTLSKNEEFLSAVSLGLFDYLRKSFSRGFAISLSGGVDSSVVTILAVDALKLALNELGIEKFLQKFAYIKEIQKDSDLGSMALKMIHTVYQSTENSSPETKAAARNLAQALGVTYTEWSVETIKQNYQSLLTNVLGRPLNWNQDDLALQNIQARVRAPGIWMLANVKGFLLLTTSNRSEAAVGYATMDGDMAGGLSPIAGVDKAFLNQWARWRSGLLVESISPALDTIPELNGVFIKSPSAELRPIGTNQKDEEDLMPYPILDFIERQLITDRVRPRDLMRVLSLQFPDYPVIQLRDWLVLFLKLWSRSQWKRERIAPAFHLDTESLDPKTWCRFPILSKAFELDIEELEQEFGG